ncbi:hypothetical protein [Herbiconiux sp. L3-i23]|uniref:hypothetical protein n=1 Tax=Herbiconiux sp. L3-i23 TaxID=2905871 RepID=UPI002069C5F0|nr:hypothetical protein [Herbiconiux sp. L3-i23]BDI23502.1 hypothetical protein L3i23_22780 [Herbiconiux sp. L3-i23]
MSEQTDSPRVGVGSRILEGGAALLLGLVVGVIGTFGHQLTFTEFGFPLPIGLVAGLAAVICLLGGIRLAFESRWYSGLAALGVVVAIGVFALPSANGSVVLPDNPAGIVWTIGPTLVAAVVLAWPDFSARPAPRPPVRNDRG